MFQKILVVEDDTEIYALIKKYISKIGSFEITFAASAEEALSFCVNSGEVLPYKLVLTDLYLPRKLTGVDVWRELKRLDPGMEFAVISSAPMQEYLKFFQPGESPPVFSQKPLMMAPLKDDFRISVSCARRRAKLPIPRHGNT